MSNNIDFTRKNKLIDTYSVGALFPLQSGQTAIILGLDSWFNGKNPLDCGAKEIIDKRFAKRLKIKHFFEPPVIDANRIKYSDNNLSIPAFRFPTLFYCPSCGMMSRDTSQLDPITKCIHSECKNTKKIMEQERFLVYSKDFDYIDDFPILEWIHKGQECPSGGKIENIKRSVSNISLGFDGISYKCTKCGVSRTLKGIYKKNALDNIVNFSDKIWLEKFNMNDFETNKVEVSVGLRSGNNIWNPKIFLSIQIDDFEYNSKFDRAKECIIENDTVFSYFLKNFNSYKDIGEVEKRLIKDLFEKSDIDDENLIEKVIDEVLIGKEKREKIGLNNDTHDFNNFVVETEYRYQEYNILTTKSEIGSINSSIHIIPIPINKYSFEFCFFDSINIIPHMVITKALLGFTRDYDNNLLKRAKDNLSSNKKLNWIPAVENFGEGIFIKFNKSALEKWVKNNFVKDRIKLMSDNRRKYNSFCSNAKNINPIFVLIHTFSHILINELSFFCGYGSSSLQERIYCEIDDDNLYDMCGVLIYVASGDIDGSLGGLVKMGNPGNFEKVIKSAINKAKWCSSDPVCIESKGQGPDSCNLAACSNCVLLPETCCDGMWNQFLDRGMLIGDLKEKEIGYFVNTEIFE